MKASEKGEREVDDLYRQEQLVDEYISRDNKESAVNLLFKLIVRYAKKKDFSKAEALRDKLYKVDLMALNEIIKSGEIIEEEKSKSKDQDHLDIWSKMYSTLTDEEANALYYAMKEASYDVDEPIFVQGKHNSNLYFIRQGRVKLVCSQEGREILLEISGPGQIVGEDTFFEYTVCTISVVALSRVKLDFVEKEVLDKWKDEFPALESRLRDYCLRLRNVEDLLKKKDLDRRRHKRVKISGKVRIQLLDVSGGRLGRAFQGDLSNISIGGLSFVMRISKRETARLLLGRNLNMQFVITAAGAQEKIDQNGTIVGLRSRPFHDYSIHVKFDGMLSGKLTKAIGY